MDICSTWLCCCYLFPYSLWGTWDLSQLGIKPVSPTLEAWSLNHWLFSYWVMSDSWWPHGLQHARLPCPLPSSRVCSNSCPLSRWCHATNSSSAVPFSFCLQSLPASGAFLVNHWIARKFLFYLPVSIMPPILFSSTLDPGVRDILSENQCISVRRIKRCFLLCRAHGSVLLATGACSPLVCLCSSYSCHVLLGDHACPPVPHRLGSGGHMDAQTV